MNFSMMRPYTAARRHCALFAVPRNAKERPKPHSLSAEIFLARVCQVIRGLVQIAVGVW